MATLEYSPLEHHTCTTEVPLDDSLDETVQPISAAQSSISYPDIAEPAIERNKRAETSTARLPPELLCEIFAHLPLADCISVSHVSHRWRKIAVDATSLWSIIKSFDQQPGILKARLARVPAGGLLKLATSFRRRGGEDLISALLTRMSDFQTLHIRFLGEFVDYDISPLTNALSYPAPNMEHLSLVCNEASPALRSERLQLLANTAPALRSLIFYGAAEIIRGWVPGATIRRLLFSQPGATTTRALEIVSQSFPCVEELTLDIDDWEMIPGSSVKAVAFPGSVRRFIIGVEFGLDLSHLLRSILHTSPPCFVVFSSGGSVTPRDMPFVLSDVLGDGVGPESVKVLSAISNSSSRLPGTNSISIHSRLPGERHRWLVNVQMLTLVTAIRSFINLTNLILGEALLTHMLVSGPHTLLNLTTLVVTILPRHLQGCLGHETIFLLRPVSSPMLICPVLDVVVLAALDRTPQTLAPDSVSDLLGYYISSQALPVLGLRNAFLLENPISAVTSLLARVRDIRQVEVSELELEDGIFVSSVVQSLSWQPPF